MPIKARYILTVSMDVQADKEALFNEVYDTEHVPLLLKVPGVVSVTRAKMEPLQMFLGGEKKTLVAEGEPSYMAIYEIVSPDVLLGECWATAVEEGRWPSQVRPYTSNRRHVLRRIL